MSQKTEIARDAESSGPIYAAFSVGFRFISQVYLEIPTREFIAEIIQKRLLFEWPVAENQEFVEEGLKILQDFCRDYQPHKIISLQQDYTRLFIGLETILAPPYASVYLSEERLLFEKPVLDVRRFYRKLGLRVAPLHGEPDDHIGFELYCLSLLSQKAAQSAGLKNIRLFETYRISLEEFLVDHLLTWIVDFFPLLKEKALTSYYRGVAFLTLGLVESLADFLEIKKT